MPKKSVEKKSTKTTTKIKKEERPVERVETTSVSELPTPQEPIAPTPPPVVKLVVEQEQSPMPPLQPETPPVTAPIITDPIATPQVEQVVPKPDITIVDGFETSHETPEKSEVTTTSDDEFEPEEKGGGAAKLILIFLTALLVGGGAVAGFFYYSKQQPQTPPPAQETPAPTQAALPAGDEEASGSATEEEVDFAAVSIQILNGSGIAGEAGRVQALLESDGFETFTVGNAGSYDFTDTEVQVKEGTSPSVFEAIKDALDTYTVVEETALADTSDYDVVITVGQTK